MSDLILSPIPVRPCAKCGATERYKSGRCKACAKASTAARYATNPDKQRAMNAAWHANNPDKHKSRVAAWRAANTDKVKAQNAAWQAANPDKVKAYDAAWKAANPESLRVSNQNRRARRKKAGGTLSKDLAAKLFKLQKGKCPCCKQPLGDDYHLDHVVPLALGGSNTDDNIQLLRQRCNSQKNAKHPVDFMQSRGLLI